MVDYREDAKWTVYVHIVPKEISGYDWDKYYVGITSRKPEERWGSNGYNYKGQGKNYFWNTIQKIGWEKIQHEIIAKNLTKDEACDIEILLIKELKSNNRENGYNLTLGGEGTKGHVLSEDSKKQISLRTRGEKNGFYGKKHTEATKKMMKENHADISGGNNYWAKTIYQFTLDGKFVAKYNAITLAYNATKIQRSNISSAASNNRIAGGFLWAFDDKVDFINGNYILLNNNYIDKRHATNIREVYQFFPDGSFVNKYESCSQAGKLNNIPVGTITYNATNKCSSKKFLWRYKEDVKESENNPDSFFIA